MLAEQAKRWFITMLPPDDCPLMLMRGMDRACPPHTTDHDPHMTRSTVRFAWGLAAVCSIKDRARSDNHASLPPDRREPHVILVDQASELQSEGFAVLTTSNAGKAGLATPMRTCALPRCCCRCWPGRCSTHQRRLTTGRCARAEGKLCQVTLPRTVSRFAPSAAVACPL